MSFSFDFSTSAAGLVPDFFEILRSASKFRAPDRDTGRARLSIRDAILGVRAGSIGTDHVRAALRRDKDNVQRLYGSA